MYVNICREYIPGVCRCVDSSVGHILANDRKGFLEEVVSELNLKEEKEFEHAERVN
jgi:hypothetical protein